MEPLSSYFIASAALLAVGVYGIVSKRNALRLLFAVEIIYNAANLNMVAFLRYLAPSSALAQTFVLFSISLAAAEAAVGLAIVIHTFRMNREIDVRLLARLRG